MVIKHSKWYDTPSKAVNISHRYRKHNPFMKENKNHTFKVQLFCQYGIDAFYKTLFISNAHTHTHTHPHPHTYTRTDTHTDIYTYIYIYVYIYTRS